MKYILSIVYCYLLLGGCVYWAYFRDNEYGPNCGTLVLGFIAVLIFVFLIALHIFAFHYYEIFS